MISEEDLEDGITPEILPEQKFQVMIKEASLDESRANYLLHNFSNHFKEASEWARKAKDIIVTNENQTVMMEMARTGRLFLSKKRQEIEKARKWMKEPALREGQAIDKIANLLKDTIIPTEQHLERQEKFIQFKREAEEERIRLEIEKKMEEDRIVKEESDRKALALAHQENERLREQSEKLRQQAKVKEDIDRVFREEKEKELQEERNKALRIERELAIRRTEELKKEADKIRAEERLLQAGDGELLLILRKSLIDIKIPDFKSAINKRIGEDIKSYIGLAILKIKIDSEEE